MNEKEIKLTDEMSDAELENVAGGADIYVSEGLWERYSQNPRISAHYKLVGTSIDPKTGEKIYHAVTVQSK